MQEILKKYLDNKIMIFSGEGLEGDFEEYTGKVTERAIKMRLTKEKCHGDRWAKAYIYARESDQGPLYVNLEYPNDTKII